MTETDVLAGLREALDRAVAYRNGVRAIRLSITGSGVPCADEIRAEKDVEAIKRTLKFVKQGGGK